MRMHKFYALADKDKERSSEEAGGNRVSVTSIFRRRRAQCGVQGGDLIHNLSIASCSLSDTDDLS